MHTSSMTRWRPHVLVAALVAALAVVAAGCGTSAVAVPELASFRTVAQKSSAADSARFSLQLELTIPGVGKPLAVDAQGGFDTAAKRAQVSFDLSSLAGLLESFGSAFGGATGGGLGSGDWKLEAIRDGDTAYVKFPPMADQLPAGKTWIKGDAKTLSSAQAGQLKQLGSLVGTDPRDVFGLLKAVSGSITAVGSDEIRGVETSHYHATIDTAKLTQLVPAAQRQSLGGLDQAAGQAGLTEIPVDVWVDSDQQVRKISIDVDAKQPGTDVAVKASLVVELYDYGTPLELTLPPADEVVDAATLKHTS